MGEKNDCMEISRDKQAKYYTGKLGLGLKKETLCEKLNLFWLQPKTTPYELTISKQE